MRAWLLTRQVHADCERLFQFSQVSFALIRRRRNTAGGWEARTSASHFLHMATTTAEKPNSNITSRRLVSRLLGRLAMSQGSAGEEVEECMDCPLCLEVSLAMHMYVCAIWARACLCVCEWVRARACVSARAFVWMFMCLCLYVCVYVCCAQKRRNPLRIWRIAYRVCMCVYVCVCVCHASCGKCVNALTTHC